MSQVPTKTVTLKSVMRRASFVRGFNEARFGMPMDYAVYEKEERERWSYERGRLFGMVFKDTLKSGNAVRVEAIWAYARAIDNKAVI